MQNLGSAQLDALDMLIVRYFNMFSQRMREQLRQTSGNKNNIKELLNSGKISLENFNRFVDEQYIPTIDGLSNPLDRIDYDVVVGNTHVTNITNLVGFRRPALQEAPNHSFSTPPSIPRQLREPPPVVRQQRTVHRTHPLQGRTLTADFELALSMQYDEEQEVDDCPICKNKMYSNKITTVCNHVFHKNCASEWFRIKRVYSCPMCRQTPCLSSL